MKIVILLVLGMLLVSTLPAMAAYSGLNIIPTVDIVDQGTIAFDFEIGGATDPLKVDTWLLGGQYGYNDRLEFGIDHDFGNDVSERNCINAKYLIPASKALKVPIALGVCNVADKVKSDMYAVTALDSQIARFSLGYGRFDAENHWFAGADRQVGNYTVMLEYVHGDSNGWVIGAARDLTGSLCLSAGLQKLNDNSDDRFIAILSYALPVGNQSE